VWNRQRTDTELADPGNVTLGQKSVQRWNLPGGWAISNRPAHPALVSEADFIAYRCRHGRTSAMTLDPARPKNTYVREDKLLPHLPPCTCFSPPPLCAPGAAPALVPMSGPPSARSR
jgi:hypothetical protein